ncbi:uncharacterized protein B0H64DRAFT_393165 [Chaetomium fimeti]|uniref:Uncharacterized protein n=1 Tax=Chaetomium fimeti TaxID=1854472 RepID=A0AAE0HKB7_9PEZI|nr:hypothetical protein B0H64DRAFT_393165 [Chaetomium fimeti]
MGPTLTAFSYLCRFGQGILGLLGVIEGTFLHNPEKRGHPKDLMLSDNFSQSRTSSSDTDRGYCVLPCLLS